MRLTLFPSLPNTTRVRELRDFRWDVALSGRSISLGLGDRPAVAEVRLAREPGAPQWQGDVLVLSDRGEFAIAVNRGLVVSVEADRLALADEGLDRETRTLRLPRKDSAGKMGPGPLTALRVLDPFSLDPFSLELLLYFEWGDDLRWRRTKEGLVHVASPGADWPLMLFLAAAPTPALVETEMERLRSVSMGDVVAMTQSFASAQPRLATCPALDALVEHVHHLHRVNTYTPEPPFLYEWECPTRADRYLSRVSGNLDTLHSVWDWILIDPTRARQEFENYLKGYDAVTCRMALDVAPLAEDVWPVGPRVETDGRCMVSSHPPLWPEVAWRLHLAAGDLSWLRVTYEVAKLNVGWWERERDRDGDGLFEWADTRFPQPWESGCDGSPRFDEIAADGFACVDLNAQMVMFYRSLVRFAVELGEREDAAEYLQREQRLAHLVNERLWDAADGWYYDFGEDGFVRVRTTAGLWAINAGIATEERLDAMLERLSDAEEFATWFPLPSVSADEPSFEPVGWRGPAWPSQALWLAMGLRQAGRVDLAGRLIRRTLDAMAEVLAKEGALYECYNPLGSDESALRLFNWNGPGEPVRRYVLGHAPVRAMVLYGLLGLEPTRDGLNVTPAEDSLEKSTRVEFTLGKHPLVLEALRKKEGLHLSVRRGRKTLAEGYGKLLVPRAGLLGKA